MNFMYIMHGFFIFQTSIQSYLKNLLYQPRQLLSAFQQLDQQQFQTAMKYLFNSRKDYLVSLCMRNRAALKGLGKGKRTRLGILPCMLGCYLAGLEQIAGAPFSRSVSKGWVSAPTLDFLSTHWRKVHLQRTVDLPAQILWGG